MLADANIDLNGIYLWYDNANERNFNNNGQEHDRGSDVTTVVNLISCLNKQKPLIGVCFIHVINNRSSLYSSGQYPISSKWSGKRKDTKQSLKYEKKKKTLFLLFLSYQNVCSYHYYYCYHYYIYLPHGTHGYV